MSETGDLTNAVKEVTQSLDKLAVTHKQTILDYAYITTVSDLVSAAFGLVVSMVIIYVAMRNFSNDRNTYGSFSDLAIVKNMIAGFTIGFFFIVWLVCVGQFLSVKKWVGLYKPEIIVIDKILEKVKK